MAALKNTDQNITKYISSINIVQKINEDECRNINATGCASANFTNDGKLAEVKIYLLDRSTYKGGICNSFGHTLYHEIGHVVYFYNFGDYGVNKQDKFYQEALELYADRYADEYSNIGTNGCDENIARQLEQVTIDNEKVYQFSRKILSKWDKYKNSGGVPQEMYDEYLYDYNAYIDAKKEYTEALDKFKVYLNK